MKITGTIGHILVELGKFGWTADKVYTCEIKEKREGRSLNANSYAWVLMDKIAEHPSIKSSKE